MNIKMLKSALAMYAASAECSDNDQVTQAMEAFAELSFVEDALENAGHDYYEVYPIPWSFIDAIINQYHYDTIGRIIKAKLAQLNMQPCQLRSADYLKSAIIKQATDEIIKSGVPALFEMDTIPQFIYKEAITYVIDLWLDNEDSGDNDPDGSFNHSDPATCESEQT